MSWPASGFCLLSLIYDHFVNIIILSFEMTHEQDKEGGQQ